MAPRRSARPTANPKPSKPALGKTKVTKPTTKKPTSKKTTTTQTPTVKEKKRTGLLWRYLLGQQAAHHSGTHLYNTNRQRGFPCGCAAAAYGFKLAIRFRFTICTSI
jgi:hypothetical protein